MLNQKRPRTDQSSDADWTCPSCGNINFSHRTRCNMRKCGAPKPLSDVAPPSPLPSTIGIPQQMPQPAPAHYAVPLPAAVQYAAPPSYLAAPGHLHLPLQASPLLYEAHAPISDLPQLPHLQHLPQLPLPYLSVAPGAYTSLDPYLRAGLPLPGLLPYAAPLPPLHAEALMQAPPPPVDGRKRRGGPDSAGPGGAGGHEQDWVCPACGNTNFAFRTKCNMRKCGAPKPESVEPAPAVGPGFGGLGLPVPPGLPFAQQPGPPVAHEPRPAKKSQGNAEAPPPEGSWKCAECGNINYPFRTHCNRRNCGAKRPPSASMANGAGGTTQEAPLPAQPEHA